jgi:hypothetical protein
MDLNIVLTGIGILVTIIGSNIALFSWLRSDMKSFESKIETDIKQAHRRMDQFYQVIQTEMKSFEAKVDVTNRRMDQLYQVIQTEMKSFEAKVDVTNRRMDQLYQVIIDMLKKG